jgi:hypothetical protein
MLIQGDEFFLDGMPNDQAVNRYRPIRADATVVGSWITAHRWSRD